MWFNAQKQLNPTQLVKFLGKCGSHVDVDESPDVALLALRIMARCKQTVRMTTTGGFLAARAGKAIAVRGCKSNGNKARHQGGKEFQNVVACNKDHLGGRKKVQNVWAEHAEAVVSELDATTTQISESDTPTSHTIWKIEINGVVHVVDKARLERLLSNDIAKWTKERPFKKLTSSMAFRWGLTETESNGKPGTPEGTDWRISKVILGDGSPGFLENCYYACDDLDGSEWHLIHLHTIELQPKGGLVADKNMKVQLTEKTADSEAIYSLGMDTLATALDKIDDWCTSNRGRAMLLSTPGARESSLEAQCHYTHDSRRLFCETESGLCSLASLLNGISWKFGREQAEDAAREVCNPGIRDVAALSRWIQTQPYFSGYALQKVEVSKLGIKERRRDEIMTWLLNQTEGIFMLRIIGTNGVDHMVAVDMDEKIILDSMEKRPMVLSEKAVHLCVGEGNRFRYCREIRLLRKLPVARRIRKTKRPRKTKNSSNNSQRVSTEDAVYTPKCN